MSELDPHHRSDTLHAPAGALEIRLAYLQLPLIVPYRLAFGDQTRFDAILVGLRDADSRMGWGEATILPGYTTETVEQGWSVASAFMQECRTSADIRRKGVVAAKTSPFVVSAFLTALNWLEGHPSLRRAGRFPLLGTINGKSDAPDALEREIETLISTGYRTLKLKVGWNVGKDIEQVNMAQKIVAGRAQLRIDGNQGYTLEQAMEFVSLLEPRDIEVLEQPCAANDWDAAVAVKRASAVPVMLDESIYTLDDVARAARLDCADFIKLKLMKLGDIDTLEHGLRMIADHGMTPVLGNGVATDLGCWMEIAAALDSVPTAGEMNGFLKTRPQLLSPALLMEGPDVILNGTLPEIDLEIIREYAVEKAGNWN